MSGRRWKGVNLMIRLLFAVSVPLPLAAARGSEARIPIDPFYGQTRNPPSGHRPDVAARCRSLLSPSSLPHAPGASRRPREDLPLPLRRPRPGQLPHLGLPASTTARWAIGRAAQGDQIEIPKPPGRAVHSTANAVAVLRPLPQARPRGRPCPHPAPAASPGRRKPRSEDRSDNCPRGEDVARQGPVYPPPTVTRATLLGRRAERSISWTRRSAAVRRSRDDPGENSAVAPLFEAGLPRRLSRKSPLARNKSRIRSATTGTAPTIAAFEAKSTGPYRRNGVGSCVTSRSTASTSMAAAWFSNSPAAQVSRR